MLFKAVLMLAVLEYGLFFGFVIVGDIVRASPEVAGDLGLSSQEGVHLAAALAFTTVVLSGLIAQLVHPIRFSGGILVTSGAVLAVMVSALIIGNPNNQGGQAGVFDPINLILLFPVALLMPLHPARRQLFRRKT